MKFKQQLLAKHKQTSKKSGSISSTKIAVYASAFLLFVAVIAIGYQKPEQTQINQVANVSTSNPLTQSSASEEPSVDEVLATNVAAELTEQTRLPIASNMANASVSLAVKSALAQTDDTVTSKPQIIHSDADARAIQTYTVKRGDTLAEIAKQFGVSAETIRWANNLSSNGVAPGKKLRILPVDGVIYTVQSGDTVESIARKHQTSAARIVTFNDLELSNPENGQRLIIPDGTLPSVDRPGYTPPTSSYQQSPSVNTATNFMSGSVGNKYAFGYCTWYAYERRAAAGRPVGSFWGNAYSWASAASSQGFKVNNTPAPGAVMQTSGGGGGYGHVAVVDKVRPNGSIVISEMNYAGWNVVSSRTISAGQAGLYTYIH